MNSNRWKLAQEFERKHWVQNRKKIMAPDYRKKIQKRSSKLQDLMLDYIDVKNPHLKVIEIGGGATQLIDFFPQTQKIAVDPLANLYQEEFGDVLQKDVKWFKGTSENLEFDDNEFDIYIMRNVLDHVSDLDKVLSEMHRVVKPGGIIYIGINVFSGLLHVYRNINKNKEHPYVFSHNGLLRIIKKQGFNINEIIEDAPEQVSHFQDIVNEAPLRSMLRKMFLKMNNYHFSEFFIKNH